MPRDCAKAGLQTRFGQKSYRCTGELSLCSEEKLKGKGSMIHRVNSGVDIAMASKKSKTKPPRGRPPATSQISQPLVEDSSFQSALSAFSHNGNLFAFVSLAVNKHRLRVYDTTSGLSIAEHTVDSAKVTCLAWTRIDLSERQTAPEEDDSGPPVKKKRKKRSSQTGDAPLHKAAVDSVLLGLSNGTLLFFSPSHGRILRTFYHPSSTSAFLSVASVDSTDRSPTVWTSGADGIIRVWHAHRNELVGTWKTDDRIPYSSMSVRPGSGAEDEDSRVDVLVANHSIHLLSCSSISTELDASEHRKPVKLASFTGHASSVASLHWDTAQKSPTRIFSTADGDRFINVWEVSTAQGASVREGKLAASIPLDSYVRCISLSAQSESSTAERQILLTLSGSGKVSIFPVPSELTPPASSKKSQQKIPTLLPRTTVSVSSKRSPPSRLVAVSFHSQDASRIHIAAIVGGARPIFDVIVSASKIQACIGLMWSAEIS